MIANINFLSLSSHIVNSHFNFTLHIGVRIYLFVQKDYRENGCRYIAINDSTVYLSFIFYAK